MKLTRKNVFELSTGKVFRCGYCGMQYLLRYSQCVGHNSGVYGWNWDAYILPDGSIITTGYRSMTGDTLKGVEEYEKAAEKIACNWDLKYEEKKEKTLELLSELIAKNINF